MRVKSAARITFPRSPYRTFADVLKRLGVSADRVRFDLKPGRATVRDLLKLQETDDRLYELVDGFLIEKVMGTMESYIAMALGRYLGNYLEIDDGGFVLGDFCDQHLEGAADHAAAVFGCWDVVCANAGGFLGCGVQRRHDDVGNSLGFGRFLG